MAEERIPLVLKTFLKGPWLMMSTWYLHRLGWFCYQHRWCPFRPIRCLDCTTQLMPLQNQCNWCTCRPVAALTSGCHAYWANYMDRIGSITKRIRKTIRNRLSTESSKWNRSELIQRYTCRPTQQLSRARYRQDSTVYARWISVEARSSCLASFV